MSLPRSGRPISLTRSHLCLSDRCGRTTTSCSTTSVRPTGSSCSSTRCCSWLWRFLPFATSVLALAFRNAQGQRTAVVFYGIAFVATALTFNAVWQYARRLRLIRETLGSIGATAIGRRFQLALAWLAIGTLLGALLPVLGVAVIAAFNAFYWLPIRGESPGPRPDAERAGPTHSPGLESSPTTPTPQEPPP